MSAQGCGAERERGFLLSQAPPPPLPSPLSSLSPNISKTKQHTHRSPSRLIDFTVPSSRRTPAPTATRRSRLAVGTAAAYRRAAGASLGKRVMGGVGG